MIPSADLFSPPSRLLSGASLDLRPDSISTAIKSRSPSLWRSVPLLATPSRPFQHHGPPAASRAGERKTPFNTQ
jgi:hypothetical protein